MSDPRLQRSARLPPGSASRPTVLVLHGMGRTGKSMHRLCADLERAGYATYAPTYPASGAPIRELAADVAERIRADLPGRRLVAVTHSLGGILVRHMAAMIPFERAVMLAPPNHGSRVARTFRGLPPFRWLTGPAGMELTDPVAWPSVSFPVAVIAGTAGGNAVSPVSWLSRGLRLFPEGVAHDGTLSVDETRLPGMASFHTVDASHDFIMDHPEARRLALRFLQEGGPVRTAVADPSRELDRASDVATEINPLGDAPLFGTSG